MKGTASLVAEKSILWSLRARFVGEESRDSSKCLRSGEFLHGSSAAPSYHGAILDFFLELFRRAPLHCLAEKALRNPPSSVIYANETPVMESTVPKRKMGFLAVIFVALTLSFLGSPDPALAQSNQPQPNPTAKKESPAPVPDLTTQPALYVVGYAHLDTQWRWEYPQVINEYLLHTMRDNFELFPKYPHYIFNFSGANRYRMMKEYYPADFAKVKEYVAAGRWFPAGSSMEENDVNSPAAESIIRQVLYGNQFFRHEFGKASAEFMLPDCFGFPASLPNLLAHAGIKGFSTQKLTLALRLIGGRPRFCGRNSRRHSL